MKKIKMIIIIALLTLSLTGCGNKEQVVIYSSMEEERNQILTKKLEEKFPDVNVAVQYMATGNSAAKIKNEGTNVEADIILDLETAHMENLKDNFANIDNFDTSYYTDGVNTSSNYVIWAKSPISLIIDKDYFNKNKLSVPKTYDDLLKSEYRDLIAMPDPKTSGTGYAFYLNTVNIMGEEDATDYFKKLKNNLREFTTSGSGPTNLLKQKEIAIAMGMISQGVAAINEGYDFEIVQLDTGILYSTTSAGVIKGRESDENVVNVFNYIITEFNKFDKENYIPSDIIKDLDIVIENYPTDLKNADMSGIESMDIKSRLTKKWEEVNG